MRKILLTLVVVIFCASVFAQQKQIIPLSANETKMELKSVNPEAFAAEISLKELKFENILIDNQSFSMMGIDGFQKPNNIGQANLPVSSNLIEVPYGAEIQVVIKSYDEELINLNDYGVNLIQPTQPSYSKSTPVEEQYFVKDVDYYNTDELESSDLIVTEIHGIMRGVRIGRIEIRPYHYNPVENTLVVYNNLDFEVNFVNADIALTNEMKSKYYTPEFEGSNKALLNYIAPMTKDEFSDYAAPVKYVIVANTVFESTLEPFVEWKTKQGYNVIEHYVASGTANTTIETYLQELYDAGIASDPAPLYVLIVGDHSGNYSIPAFSGDAGSHVTDLYFACYDGTSDNLPDLYYGRISANSTTELQNALDKIIPYEMYTIPDGDYLNNCMIIAGVDASYAPSHGDGTLYYGINNYFNEDHGFNNIYAYYHSYDDSGDEYSYNVMSSSSSSAENSIKSEIASGVGFANYTAHCDYYGWYNPAIRNDDISSFNNADKYPFMIGNCCLSYEFNNSTDAFGEQVVYAANEGAIGYIGGSNSTYWDEDVYWGIGLTSISISESNVDNHTYVNTGLGAYDGIFHENGEAYSDWYYTGRQIVHKGNLAVQASSSSLKEYYWEIYHLSGDPSIMPYMSEPDELTLSFANPMIGTSSLVVTTEPYTYVALSKDNVLLDAKWSGAGTSVTLTPSSNFTDDTYCIVGTKQDRAPYINESVNPIASNSPVAAFSGTPTTILEGESVTFTDASQYAVEWAWTFGDGGTSAEQNPVHTYTAAGTYTVSLTVTNPLGFDTETKTDYITVNVNTNPPTADFVASQTSISILTSINFTDLSTNNPTSWSWEFEGGSPSTSTAQNPIGITYNNAGTYNVTLTATNDNGSDVELKSSYIVVTVPDYCDAEGTEEDEYISNVTFNTIDNDSEWDGYADYTSSQSTNVTVGDSYSIAITDETYYSRDEILVWIDYNIDGDFEDIGELVYEGAATGSSTSNPYTWTGTVDIPLTATIGTTRMRVRLNYDTEFQGSVPNDEPCGDATYGEVEDYAIVIEPVIVSQIAEFSADDAAYSIYPNPTYDLFYVQFDDQISETIEIYDMIGQVVGTFNPTQDKVTIDVSKLKSGIYFVKLRFADKEFTNKLVVR